MMMSGSVWANCLDRAVKVSQAKSPRLVNSTALAPPRAQARITSAQTAGSA
ncbi:hypothetical protein D3C73_542620 [compost metagenome]